MADIDLATADLSTTLENFSASEHGQPVAQAIALFDAARGQCPIPHSSRFGGYYLMLKDKDVRKAMLNWRTFVNSPSVLRPLTEKAEDQIRNPPLDFDGDEHAAWRKLVIDIINPKSTLRVQEKVKSDVVKILDEMARKGEADFVTDLGDVIPALAIFYLLGIDDSGEQRQVFELTRAMLTTFNDAATRQEHIRQIAAFGIEQANRRRKEPRDDALTQIALAELQGRALSDDEIGAIMFTILAAGSGTTATGLTSLVHEVLSRPWLRASLISDPSLIPAAVDESLRLHAPFIGLYRRVAEDVEISGSKLPKGSTALMCWQSANLDPEVFDQPHEFRLDRKRGHHLSFGIGRHACPGSSLARMQMTVVLEQLLARYPDVALASKTPVEEVFIGANSAAIGSLLLSFRK